jgi:3-oxoacyl-[acyl-carrier protein] reductase
MSDPRVALVTGASRGIGRAIAARLGADGYRVAITYSKDQTGASETVADIGDQALAIRADAADPAAVDAAFAEIEQHWGRVELLVNNAGINADGLVLRMSDDQWSSVVRTNLDGCFYAIRRAVPGMMRARFGRIVNVTSVGGQGGRRGPLAIRCPGVRVP